MVLPTAMTICSGSQPYTLACMQHHAWAALYGMTFGYVSNRAAVFRELQHGMGTERQYLHSKVNSHLLVAEVGCALGAHTARS